MKAELSEFPGKNPKGSRGESRRSEILRPGVPGVHPINPTSDPIGFHHPADGWKATLSGGIPNESARERNAAKPMAGFIRQDPSNWTPSNEIESLLTPIQRSSVPAV